MKTIFFIYFILVAFNGYECLSVVIIADNLHLLW